MRHTFRLLVSIVITLLYGVSAWTNSNAAAPAPQTHVSGQMRADTTWDVARSPFMLDANVGVPAGKTLTIQPGVTVYAQPDAALQIEGKLVAEGTPNNHITFTCAVQPCATHPWGGIDFVQGAGPGTSISYADLSGAGTLIHAFPSGTLSHLS